MQVAENIMFVRLSFTMPRQTRKVKAQAEEVAQDRLRATARLYSGKAFQAIRTHDYETRDIVKRLAIDIPTAFRGTYVLPAGMADKLVQRIQARQTERAALADKFIAEEYETEKTAARAALGSSYRDQDFPAADMIRTAFRSDYSIFRLDVPDASTLPPELIEAERAKYRETMATVTQECRDALRLTLVELVGHLAEKLAPDQEGNRKKLYATTVEDLREFLDTVDGRDITDDAQLRELSAKARTVLGEYNADQLKAPIIAQTIRTQLDSVKTALDALITTEGSRKIDLSIGD